ncbi:MAG: hypothetical protein MUO31_03995 [Thermodesulfovibrionales bacterium]|nr:hypothetical protein [Thermodesulfovibrionales bacterium]
MKFEVISVATVADLQKRLEVFRHNHKKAEFLGMAQNAIVTPHQFPGKEITYSTIILTTICYKETL